MANTHRSPISQAKLDANRRAKMPTREEIELAAAMFPDNPFAAAAEATRMAYERRTERRQ